MNSFYAAEHEITTNDLFNETYAVFFQIYLQIKKEVLSLHRFKRKVLFWKRSFGEVAEWSIAAVLKTVVLRGTRGSNPCLSAINAENQRIVKYTPNFTPKNVKLGAFVLFKK